MAKNWHVRGTRGSYANSHGAYLTVSLLPLAPLLFLLAPFIHLFLNCSPHKGQVNKANSACAACPEWSVKSPHPQPDNAADCAPHTYRDSQGHIYKLTHTHTYTQSSKPAVVDSAKALSRNHTKPLSISAPKSRPHFLSARSASFCGSAFVPTRTLIHNLLGRQLTRPTPEAYIHTYISYTLLDTFTANCLYLIV